ncbi:MAG TPA: FtsX-like permease family protein, partial [Mucilaginibacter sp.]
AKWDSTLSPKQNTFMAEIKRIPGVLGAAFSWSLPGDELDSFSDMQAIDQLGLSQFSISISGIGPDFISLYQMKMLAGRTFVSTDYYPKEGSPINLILNSTAIKMLGFKSPASAIGRQLSRPVGNYNVVGVVADFHQKSLHYPIEPTMFYPGPGNLHSPFSVKVDPHHLNATIDAIKQKYDAIFPGNIFDYNFLDEKFNRQYSSDQLFGRVFSIFSALAIFIACLGLLGLSLFTTLQRSKEIGIRKVLGASVGNIVLTLSKDFIRLVLLAVLIASPIAWIIMHNWLQNFVIRISISWWIFAGSGLLAAIIAFITISFQSVKAATANPVKSLRSE